MKYNERSVNATSRNQELTSYEEGEAIKTTVRKCDEQEPETYSLQRETGHRDDGQQTRRAETRDLQATKKKKPLR